MERSNDGLSTRIEELKKALSSKEERIVQLELDNSTLEGKMRISESTLGETQRKLDETVERLAIEKSEHDELKDRSQVEIERLRQQLQDATEELRVREAITSPTSGSVGKPGEGDEKLEGEIGGNSDESDSDSRIVNSSSYVKGNDEYMCKFATNSSNRQRSLKLVNLLLDNINARLGQLSINTML